MSIMQEDIWAGTCSYELYPRTGLEIIENNLHPLALYIFIGAGQSGLSTTRRQGLQLNDVVIQMSNLELSFGIQQRYRPIKW